MVLRFDHLGIGVTTRSFYRHRSQGPSLRMSDSVGLAGVESEICFLGEISGNIAAGPETPVGGRLVRHHEVTLTLVSF